MKKPHGSILFVFCFQKELNKVVFNQFSYTSVTLWLPLKMFAIDKHKYENDNFDSNSLPFVGLRP